MDDFTTARDALNQHLRDATAADPLLALTAIGAVERDVAGHQREAVRAAAQRHSWTEIGEALGVSKQAAHQRFAKEWANALKGELKADHKTYRTALKKGDLHDAADAKAKRDAVIAEFKAVGRRRA
jgi:hypothetical protein